LKRGSGLIPYTHTAAEGDGTWDGGCTSCKDLLEDRGVTQAVLAEEVAHLHKKVKIDLEKFSQVNELKELKKKRKSPAEVAASSKSAKTDPEVKSEVKEEISDDEQGDVAVARAVDAEDDWEDAKLGKEELARTGVSIGLLWT